MVYDFKKIESEILAFWKKNDIYKQAQQKGDKPFTFLQGPPYTSGRLHIGHAWNGALKDVVLRYKRMQGFKVWDRAGYDMHGLPTENKVQQKHGFTHKEDIEAFGIKPFIEECIAFSTENAQIMNKDLANMGIWMDYENAYLPVKNDFIQNQWWLVKRAHERNRLYKAKKVMTWCAHSETTLAKHELEYHTVKDPSIFLKFALQSSADTYVVIWTTTPWTIPFNLAVMVNPDAYYVKIKVDNEYWIIAKDLVAPFMGMVVQKEYTIVDTFLGSTLEGVGYKHPLADVVTFAQEGVAIDDTRLHTILLSSEHVDTTSGTGLVHCAPGCGPEDYEVGKQYGLGPYNTINEQGYFSEGAFTGKRAKEDDVFFIQYFKQLGCLVAKQTIEHEYPHDWRHHKPVIFRATDQWFFKVEDLREKLLEANSHVRWVPGFGKEAFASWIRHLKDNSITRQRYWGCPVPIWVNIADEHDIIVVGSSEELASYGVEVPQNLHRPFIDEVVIQKDGKTYKRVSEVMDVWLDSGTVSWNSVNYPMQQDIFNAHFPVDFILEATEQIRLWFSMLQMCYYIAFEGTDRLDKNAPTYTPTVFKDVYMTGMIMDFQGVKMSKSLGNIISPYEVMDKHGADVMRYYLASVPAGQNMNFSWDEVVLRYRNLDVLHNVVQYLVEYVRVQQVQCVDVSECTLGVEERYILALTQKTIDEVVTILNAYGLDKAIGSIEFLFLQLSRSYMQAVRDKSIVGTDEQKQTVASVIAYVSTQVLGMLSIYCPFLSEHLYQALKPIVGKSEESIHLCGFPKVMSKYVDKELVVAYQKCEKIIQRILAGREKIKLNVRWPLAQVIVEDTDTSWQAYSDVICYAANVKSLQVVSLFEGAQRVVKPNYKELGSDFGKDTALIAQAIAKNPQNYNFLVLSEPQQLLVEEGKEPYMIYKKHVTITTEAQEPYVCVDNVFIDTTRTEDLDDEGFVREIMRRIQTMRKDMKLSREQLITVSMSCSERIQKAVDKWREHMYEKCGLSSVDFVSEALPTSFIIKEETMSLRLNDV
ncbi:MAG: isoleucine--tRNA ligase [Candidatus Woesearchaeota archaeon]